MTDQTPNTKVFQKVQFKEIDLSSFKTDEELKTLHPADFMEEIDKMHLILEKKAISIRKEKNITFTEFNTQWKKVMLEFGRWSHILNKEIIRLSKDEELSEGIRQKYSWVYAYWWNLYHRIQYDYSKFSRSQRIIVNKNLLEKIEKGRNTLKRLILNQVSLDKIHPQFLEMMKAVAAMEDLSKVLPVEQESNEDQ